MSHFIAMSGDHGCLPDHCDVYPTIEGAQADLIGLFELGKGRARELRSYSHLELNPSRDGASYCEVEECTCDEPWIHSDGFTKEQFIREYGDDYGITADDE